jgi:Glycosyltransferase family 28 C-terminal domain
MIGYYVHHVGHGHQHRAEALAAAMGEPVTGFSSLPAPAGWTGPWIHLDRDDDDEIEVDRTARDRLHWAPLGHRGLRQRMAEIAAWIRHVSPTAFVVDVSVEVALLVRLHGIPVVTVAPPGERGDQAHRLGFDVSDGVVGCWPPEATGMLRGVSPSVSQRLTHVGALSRFPVASPATRRPGPRRVVLLSGTGGHTLEREDLQVARQETPDWEWTVLDRELGTWSDDPYPLLLDADVVVTTAGENALAEVAAARKPAVVVPQDRPHDEQRVAAEALWVGGWPALVVDAWPHQDWAKRLEQAATLDGQDWASWCDGRAADRFADVVRTVALEEATP